MPPPDYTPYKKVVPPGGIAFLTDANGVSYDAQGNILPPPELNDPYVQRYIAEQRAAAEPWSSYIGAAGSNLLNVAQGFLPTALGGRGDIGVSDIAMGAVQGGMDVAQKQKQMLSGEMSMDDPLDPRRPNPAAVEANFDTAGYFTGASAVAPGPDDALRAGIKGIKNLKGEKIPAPRVFYRGSVPNETKRIETGKEKWDSYLFAADNQEDAKLYGSSIQILEAAPDAKILYEGTAEWVDTVGRWRKNENMLEYADRAALAAKEAGYDAAWFKRQGDIGTAIFNPEKFFTPKDTTTLNSGLGGALDRLTKPKTKVQDIPKQKAQRDANGFYSRAEETLLNWQPQKNATVQQFIAFMKENGVKQPEIDAITRAYPDTSIPADPKSLQFAIRQNLPQVNIVPTDRWENYTMPGGTNYRMMNIQWANPDANYSADPFIDPVHQTPPNTLTFALLKDDVYTDPQTNTAKKVLRVEELQSDPSQKSKGKWKLPASPDRIEVKRVPLSELREVFKNEGTLAADLEEMAKKTGATEYSLYRVKGQSSKWEVAGTEPTDAEFLFNEYRDTYGEELKRIGTMATPTTEIEQMFYNEQFGRPPMPYATQGSSGIVPMAMKHLLIEAAKNGHDEIVFAPGQALANKYAPNDPDSKRAKGLRDYQDNIIPKELKPLFKRIEKESGIKGLKAEVEERPFIDVGDPNKNLPWQDPSSWMMSQDLSDFAVHSLEEQDKVGVLFRRAADSITQNTGTPDEVFTELGNNIRADLKNFQDQFDGYQQIVNDIESKPVTSDAYEVSRYVDAIERSERLRSQLSQTQSKLELLPKARELFTYWEQNVKKPPTPEERKGLVIKLSPDLRNYINKNGLEYFAKGGLVDLAKIAARRQKSAFA
jgi:hypothetical protein